MPFAKREVISWLSALERRSPACCADHESAPGEIREGATATIEVRHPIAKPESCRGCDKALTLELAPIGLRLFSRVFDELERGVRRAVLQDAELATWEPALDGVPPLWRPDVPQLGSSRFQTVTDRFTAAV